MEESRPNKKMRKTQEIGGQKAGLPPEIIEAILSRVPVKPLCQLKLVSKSLSDPDFVANYNKDVFFQRRRLLYTVGDFDGDDTPQYRSLYSLDLDKFLNENHDGDTLVEASTELDYFYSDEDLADKRIQWSPSVPFSSCHGLFMSGSFHTDSCILSNPVTQQSKIIPDPPKWEPRKTSQWWLHGLGFDYSTNQHKVIYGQDYKDYGIVFSVYTLQADSWRKIDSSFPYEGRANVGIVVNGAVHWLVKKLADGKFVIIRFLLAEEKVEEIELPPNNKAFGLGAFRNSLCLTFYSETKTRNDFWFMKEYGVSESWTKMKVPKPYERLWHSGFWTETHDLMVFDNLSLVMCNFSDGTSWNLPIGDLGENCSFGSVCTYVECLPSKVEASVSNRASWQGGRKKPCEHNSSDWPCGAWVMRRSRGGRLKFVYEYF